MERLTHRYGPDGRAVPTEFDIGPIAGIQDDDIWAGFDALVNRLAAYEDTGLEPEDIKKAFNEDAVVKLAAQALGTTPDRLRELVEADNEWRVLPEKSMWTATCHGKKLVLILDVKAAQEAEAALGGVQT